MPISEVLWPEDRIEHIAEHGVTPEEFEEVCFGQSLVLRTRATGKNPAYYVLGETESGRHVFCVVIEFPGGGLPGIGWLESCGSSDGEGCHRRQNPRQSQVSGRGPVNSNSSLACARAGA